MLRRPATSRARRDRPTGDAIRRDRPSLDRRRETFAALVAAQDSGAPVGRSRAEVADRFGVSGAEVAAIEREGLDNEWPSLG